MSGLLRCASCGEVHWNLDLGATADGPATCRVCGSELRAEQRRPGGRFDRTGTERRDLFEPEATPELGGSASS